MSTFLNDPVKQSIVVKSQFQDRSVTLDLSGLLSTPIASVAVASLSPVTTPALTVTTTVTTTVSLLLTGGVDGVSYGINLVITDNVGDTYQHTVGVVVKDELATQYRESNPYAFQSLLGTMEPGSAVIGKSFFMLPATVDATQGQVTWVLLDKQGSSYASGNAYDFRLNRTSTYVSVEALAVVNAPSSIPPSLATDHYQIRWCLTVGTTTMYAFESIQISAAFSVPHGAPDVVELVGDTASLEMVIDKPYDSVSASVFTSVGSALLVPSLPIASTIRVSNGYYYKANYDTTNTPVSLDPLIISWKFNNVVGPAFRETGQLFVVNASILRAIKSIESVVAKAKTTLNGFRDELFTVPVIVLMLARGRDMLNGAGTIPTSFDCTNADSFVREFWLRYTEVSLLQAQYLLEGEKSYSFTGQEISVERDVTQFYQGLANDLKSQLDQDIKPIKQSLAIKGITGVGVQQVL
jgi:hypothetical protein